MEKDNKICDLPMVHLAQMRDGNDDKILLHLALLVDVGKESLFSN